MTTPTRSVSTEIRIMLKIYIYAQCDTCRKAVKWLREHNIAFEERPIRETPPSRAELRVMLAANGGEMRKLFNTSGRDYREQELGAKLSTLSESEAFDLMAANGNLVKRPFLIGKGVALVGFNPATWAEHVPAGR